jgi:hypothetical protein
MSHHSQSEDQVVSTGTREYIMQKNGIYSNTVDTDLFLDQAKPSYIGGAYCQLSAVRRQTAVSVKQVAAWNS